MNGKSNLIEKILNEQNIFNSIFCMESYVFDKGLLDTKKPVLSFNDNGVSNAPIASNDLELYYALADKYNVELIEKVIDCCQQKMKWLFADKERLFDATVYFKLKSYDNGKLKFVRCIRQG